MRDGVILRADENDLPSANIQYMFVFRHGGYYVGGTPEPQRIFRNLDTWGGPGPYFEEITEEVFNDFLARSPSMAPATTGER